MSAITVSSKFQVVIPKEIRDRKKIKPGQKMEMMIVDDVIELVPVLPMRKTRGIAKGIDTTLLREKDRL